MRHVYTLATIAIICIIGDESALAQSASQSVFIRATVPKFCTVGGTIKSVDFVVTIHVGATGTIDSSIQSFTTPSVICNTTADLTATSKYGGARRNRKPSDAVGLEADIVDYIGSATFGGATTTINTAAKSSAAGPEPGSPGFVAVASVGNLFVTVSPLHSAVFVAPGVTYTDVLRITLHPR